MTATPDKYPASIGGLKSVLLPHATLCECPFIDADWPHVRNAPGEPRRTRACSVRTTVAYGATPLCLAHAIMEHSRSEGRSDADLRRVLPGDEP